MKLFSIYVEGIGFGETYTLMAKDLTSAKRKAKRRAISEFRNSLRCTKEDVF